MSTFLDVAEFRRLARQGAHPSGGVAALSARAIRQLDGRVIRFIFSDGTVDRAGDTIDPAGWDLSGYRRNPVALWAHDALAPPIGRTVNLFVDARGLVGDVEFAEPDVYDFADTIYRLLGAGFIKAGSVGFLPVDYSFANDKGREFGIDFHRQELLEFSIVPVPANANALIAAEAKSVITAKEAIMLRARSYGNVDEAETRRRRVAMLPAPSDVADDGETERRRRLMALGSLSSRRAPSQTIPTPSRATALLQFAGTLAERDRQVDRAYPGLAAQEYRAAGAAADTDTESGRRAICEAMAIYEWRKANHGCA